ncbi:MAG: M48 family metallopeptidase [Sedimentisphaerales bacterium]|nr:M48 family metallopeptidase [Sedimentisphaerales bacterium]
MWELIRANKRNSVLLIIAMAMLLGAVGAIIGVAVAGPRGTLMGVVVAVAIWMILMMVSLSSGDQILLASSKAQKVTKEVHPQLFNVVEEMTIAANLPKMPDIYIINDPGMNAFATGRNPENASVAVTAGLLGRLNRDELQGVIAHEISHILHRDILFVTLAGVMLGAVVLISQVFLRATLWGGMGRSRYSSRSREGGGQAIIIIVALVLAILAPIFAQLLYFALSRKREYLADAGAARLTRYPEGLANALEKIARGHPQVAVANKVTAPMYIINPLKEKMDLSAWTSTHPPIEKRIQILRNMSHGAAYIDYEKSYERVTHEHIIPSSALKEKDHVALREGITTAATVMAGAMATEGIQRKTRREVGDIMHRVNKMAFLTCPCGLKMKIPPTYKHKQVRCPRCGYVSTIS